MQTVECKNQNVKKKKLNYQNKVYVKRNYNLLEVYYDGYEVIKGKWEEEKWKTNWTSFYTQRKDKLSGWCFI